MARLIINAGGAERTVELTPGKPLSVGREPTNDVPLPDERQASRRHCEVRSAGAGWEVADLGATNKTRVNGQPIEKRALSSGDVIEVGKVTLRFEDPQEEARLAEAGRQGVCFLEWADGAKKGQRVLLQGPRTTLGRRPGNTIVLDDRMASGHHAEIVKDLNGYTVRDLGSTNGILVNGNPTTESPLAHGARLRVGGSRFVFKDPSMKDVEVELSRLEDDDGWGMMGDIDLSRSYGGKGGTIAALGVLALVGAGGWYMWSEGGKMGPQAQTARGERIENGGFDGNDVPWTWTDGGPVSVARVGTPGNGSLRITRGDTPEDEVVAYDGEFERTDGRLLDVKARLRGAGEFVAVWSVEADRATGTTGVTRTVVLGTAVEGSVSTRLSFPSWASRLRLGVRVPRGGTLTLDDVSVRTPDGEPATVVRRLGGQAQGVVEGDGSLSIAVGRTVLASGGLPVAWKGSQELAFRAGGPPREEGGAAVVEGVFRGGETELPGRIAWTVGEEGLLASADCAGADRLGLVVDLPRAHVGGSLNVLTTSDARAVSLAAGSTVPGVRKTLAGTPVRDGNRPATLLAFAPSATADGAAAELRVADGADAGAVRLVHVLPGASARVQIASDFTRQAQAAQQALDQAKALAARAPGEGARALRQVAQEYPFEAKVQEEASRLAAQLDANAAQELGELREALQAFRTLGSPAALADLQARTGRLSATYLAGAAAPAEGSFEASLAAVVRDAENAARGFAVARALPDAERLMRAADMLRGSRGFEAMAAIVYGSVTRSYGALGGDAGPMAELVAEAAARLAELEQDPAVKAVLPPR